MQASLNFSSQTQPGTLVICDCGSLQTWRRYLRTIVRPDRLPPVLVALPALSAEQNGTLSALAHEYRQACGCGSAALAASTAIAATVATYFVLGGQLNVIGTKHVMSLVGITVLAVVVGKAFGLLWARWRLLRLATELSGSMAGVAR